MRITINYHGKFKDKIEIDELVLDQDEIEMFHILLHLGNMCGGLENVFDTTNISLGKTFDIKVNNNFILNFAHVIKDGDKIDFYGR